MTDQSKKPEYKDVVQKPILYESAADQVERKRQELAALPGGKLFIRENAEKPKTDN